MTSAKFPTRYIGMVIKRNDDWKAVRVRVQQLLRHEYLNVYYNKRVHFWAADAEGQCGNGDIVEIKQLEEPQSDRIKHFVKGVEFGLGNIIDPITGRRCRGPQFINEDLRKFGPDSKEQTVEQ